MLGARSERRERRRAMRFAILLLVGIAVAAPAARADVVSARRRWSELQAQDAAVLAPKLCREAAAAMQALERTPDDGGEPLAIAERRLQALDVAVRRACALWPDLLALRSEARAAGGPRRDPRRWTSAENILAAAAQKLEAGRAEAARQQASGARPLYEAVRWTAWRADVLQGADSLVAWLELQKSREYVPRSYVRALDAVAAADKLLGERGRPDDDVRAAGGRASSAARHAQYLLERIRAACDQRAPDRLESSILEWEDSATRALQAMGLVASFEAGLAPPLARIEQEAERLRRERDRLRIDTSHRAGLADSLREQFETLRDTLRDRDLQIAELRRAQVEQQTVASIQGLFGRDEGRVLIDGRDLILRLHGLQFESGKADLPPEASPLLDKISRTVKLLRGTRLVVEGHTDAQGKPASNLELSQQRAEAVRDELIRSSGLEPGGITAIGYGASRPVATNDTEGGRALNRRIEIVLARPE